MKKLIRTLLLAGLALTSCNNEPKTETADNKQEQTDPKQEFEKLNEFLKKFDDPSQSFKAPTDKPIKVLGKQGTIIHINPSDLETESGQPIGKEVVIELKELSNRQQLLRANAQTISDGQLLISGGAYYINATSDGQQLKLKDGKTYSVEFPRISNDNDLELYYGQRDSSNKMDWKRAEQKFETQKLKNDSSKEYEAIIVADGMRHLDTARVAMKNMSKQDSEKMKQEGKVFDKAYKPLYKAVPVRKLGWVNCDKVLPRVPMTNIQFTISNKAEDANYIKVYLIYEDINSVLQTTYYSYNGKIEKDDFNNIAIGANVRFFAVCYQHQKILATLTDTIKVTEKLSENLLLQEMNEMDFDKLMKNVERSQTSTTFQTSSRLLSDI